jgi:hypothetical protein
MSLDKSGKVWGIYAIEESKVDVGEGESKESTPVETDIYMLAEFDTLTSIDIKHEGQITRYPVEEGGFASVAKVNSPIELTVTGIKTETEDLETQNEEEIQEFIERAKETEIEENYKVEIKPADKPHIALAIAELERYKGGTKLVTIVTPYRVFEDFNLIRFSYKHTTENGTSMLEATMTFQEVRSVKADYTTIKTNNENYATIEDTGKQAGTNPEREASDAYLLMHGQYEDTVGYGIWQNIKSGFSNLGSFIGR